MDSIDKIDSLTWLSFKFDLTATEHKSLGDALKHFEWVIFLELKGTWFNNGYFNPAYYAEPYDKNGLKIDSLHLNNWILSDLKISGSYPRVDINFTLTDPWGIPKQNLFGKNREGLRSALSVLKAASRFSNFTDFIQQDPNCAYENLLKIKTEEVQALQKENLLISNEVSILKQEINTLQCQIESIKTLLQGNNDKAL